MDDALLRERARSAIREGKLPAGAPHRTWGGPGSGVPCVVCELPVSRDGMGFQVQFVPGRDAPPVDVYHVHTGCYTAWEVERTRLAGASGLG
jgi:hypothetical protein